MLLLLLLGLVLNGCLGFDPSQYPNSKQPLPRYAVYWRVDEAKQVLHLALHVNTTGWVGFGISEMTSGSMPGSDVVMGYVKNGEGTITDGWASAFAFPNEDDCQDWVLVAAEEVNGQTTLEIERALDTKDAQDRVIMPGVNMIVVAFGESDTISYHRDNRITSEIVFFGGSQVPSLPSDAKSMDLLMGNYTVPDAGTNYVCRSFALPADQLYQIVRIDPIIQPENVEHVHHFLVHSCSNTTGGYVSRYGTPGVCHSPVGSPTGGCTGLLSGWAAGGGPAYTPEVAGFPMGAGEFSTKYIVLEVHYNNPDGVGGYTDNSGIRIWYTTQIRQYEAAMITLGDPLIFFDVVPPLTIKEYETECPTVCTNTMPFEITIFQSFPHMHQVGAEIWTTQWRNGTQIAEFGRVEFWDFNHQMSQIVNITIQPGDRLNTHCVYDTRMKNTPTPFGTASSEEMCMHFLSYYPRIINANDELFAQCGYAGERGTICGQVAVKNFINYTNPSIFDPPGGANKTFGVAGEECAPLPSDEPEEGAASRVAVPLLFSLLSLFLVVAR